MKKEEIIKLFSTQDLKSEIERRENLGGIFEVISFNGYTTDFYAYPLHLIQGENGDTRIVQLVGNVSNDYLNSMEPTLSDEDEEYDEEWEDFETFKETYFIGKKLKISSFKPFLVAEIL